MPLQIAHPRFAGVVANNGGQRGVGDLELRFVQTGFLALACHQVFVGDLPLFVLRVAGQRQHLHAVAQRAGNGVHHIGGGNEQHLRQVKRHAQVVVPKIVVLFGVQHLQQRRRRVAMHARAQLVDLVEHHHAAARAGFFECLNDVARQRANVGAPVPAHLGLVMHAA